MREYGVHASVAVAIRCPPMKMLWGIFYSLTFSLSCVCAAQAADVAREHQDIQGIKHHALELNRDLRMLEEEMLHPENSRLTVYLSVEAAASPSLQAVVLSIDGNEAIQYLYTHQQLEALRRGGVHQLYIGKMKDGEHQIAAVFTGRDFEGGDHRGSAQFTIEKNSGAKNVELKIFSFSNLQQAEFTVKDW